MTISILSGGQRDMTAAQFKAAAARNGFRVGPFGLEFNPTAPDVRGDRCSRHSYGYVCAKSPFRVLRRASLAAAIQQRAIDYP